MNEIQHDMVSSMLSILTKNIGTDFERYFDNKLTFNLPIFPVEDVEVLCNIVTDIFSKEDAVLTIDGPVVVVGSLHGHIFDLLRVLKLNGFPPETKYLFMGNFINNGDFSLETSIILFCLKALYPQHVSIIRGNNEFDYMCSRYGLFNEIAKSYNNSRAYGAFLSAFAQIPLACVINNNIVCLSAGIGPKNKSIRKLIDFPRPIHEFKDDFISSILWSEPSQNHNYFVPNPNGNGYSFGKQSFMEFMQHNSYKIMIRTQNNIPEGHCYGFDDRLISISSTSSTIEKELNMTSILTVLPDSMIKVISMISLRDLKRDDVVFIRSIQPKSIEVEECFSSETTHNEALPSLKKSKNQTTASTLPPTISMRIIKFCAKSTSVKKSSSRIGMAIPIIVGNKNSR